MNARQRLVQLQHKIAELKARKCESVTAADDRHNAGSLLQTLTDLTDDLSSCLEQQEEQEKRMNSLLDVLLKYTLLDFSEKNKISDKGDGIDAVGAGLNAMGEELQYHIGKLNESEKKIKTIFAHAPDAIIVIDSKGSITTWNSAAERIFGWKAEEVLGKPLNELLIPEQYRESLVEGVLNFSRPDKSSVLNKAVQMPVLCKDQSIIDVELTIASTTLNEEHIFIAFLRDITERKKAEGAIKGLTATLEQRVLERTEALRRSEHKYRRFFASSPLPMWLVELPSLRFIDVNESALQHYGYSREEFLSMTALDIRPEDEKRRYEQLDNSGHLGKKDLGQWRHLKKDGSVIHVEISVHDLEYDGRVARLSVVHDITEKVRYEEALRRSEERFRRIYEARMMGYAFWNASGEILDANDYFLELIGYSREQLQSRGLNWADITPPEYNEADRIALEEIARSGACQPFEKEYIRPDGTRVPVMIGAASLEEGANESGVACIIDISQRKKMENEIIELNRGLEEKVELRTEQLQQANKELESFSYSVSHDLRAPLRAIHGFSRILLEDYEDKLDEEGMRLLNTVMKNAKKMGSLIDELLEFSRLGKREISKSTVDLDNVLTEVVKELSLAHPHNAKLHIHPLGMATADYTLLKLVYQNLLINAIKYSAKKDMPEITIGVLEQGSTKTYYVKDNGAGFDMAYYDKLFGVFQRLHRQEEFEGIGVGLAIVQRIISKHGGKVWAEGKLNEGATFYFTLEKQ